MTQGGFNSPFTIGDGVIWAWASAGLMLFTGVFAVFLSYKIEKTDKSEAREQPNVMEVYENKQFYV